MTAVHIALFTALGLLLLKPCALWLFSLCYKLYRSDSALFYPAAAMMIPIDLLFNVTWGTWIFRELPRELAFSDRVRRHLRESAHDTNGYVEAVWWKSELNERWPGHIRP